MASTYEKMISIFGRINLSIQHVILTFTHARCSKPCKVVNMHLARDVLTLQYSKKQITIA